MLVWASVARDMARLHKASDMEWQHKAPIRKLIAIYQ